MAGANRTAVAEAAVERIDTWLRQHAPRAHATLRPPASEADLTAAQEAVGRPLPTDLQAWWRYADGAQMGPGFDGGSLIPQHFVPYPVAEALKTRRIWMDVARQLGPIELLEPFIESQNRLPAGTRCETWLPAWLPVANDGGGNDLFVDLRDGRRNGCVTSFYRDYGASDEPEWADTAAMLFDIAERLDEDKAWIDDKGRIIWWRDPWAR